MARSPAPPPPSHWQRARPVLLSAAVLALALLGAEFALRRLRPERAPLRLDHLRDALRGDARARFLDLVQPDAETFWRLAPDVVLPDDERPFFGRISNGQGLREERDVGPKAPGELRVLFLGDSCTFGYLVRCEESYVQVAEQALRGTLPDVPVECLNAGVPGYSLFQGWRWLETRAAGFEPDVVVFNFGWNDAVSWDGQSDFDVYLQRRERRPPGILARSRLAQVLWELVAEEAPPAPRGQPRPRLTAQEFGELLERCRASTQALGAQMVLLVGGSRLNLRPDPRGRPLSEYQKQQFAFATATGVPLVDGIEVATALATEAPIDQVFLDMMHPSARLDRALGEALATRLAAWARAR